MPLGKQPLKCRLCNVEATLTKSGKQKIVTCPRCGLTHDFRQVQRMVVNQAEAYADKKVQQALDREFRSGRSGNVTLHYSSTPIRQPVGEFYVDLD